MRETASDFMDLTSCTWMVRELGESVSCTKLLDDNSLLVGGWDGQIKYWTNGGDLVWECETPNRISSIEVQGDVIFSTSGLHVVCIGLETGHVRWSVALEGSADTVIATKKCVLAVSSVYDIEHNDFIESALWAISFQGDVLETHRMDERPWTLHHFNEGAIAGLGRPRNGFITLSDSGEILEHNKDWDSPTICSTNAHEPIFGLADGSIRTMDGMVINTMDSAVSSLEGYEGGFLIADDEGVVEFFKSSAQWSIQGSEVVALSGGFTVNENATCWIARWNGSKGELVVHSIADGQQIATLHGLRVHDMASNKNRIAIGCENGQVFVWDHDLFQRRMEQPSQPETDAKRNAMFEKLRSLRK